MHCLIPSSVDFCSLQKLRGYFILKPADASCYSRLVLDNPSASLSLILRPSHCPVFDCLQHAKTEGEGLIDPFYHVNDDYV